MSISRRLGSVWLCALVLTGVAAACGQPENGQCLRNTDCNSGFVCSQTGCVLATPEAGFDDDAGDADIDGSLLSPDASAGLDASLSDATMTSDGVASDQGAPGSDSSTGSDASGGDGAASDGGSDADGAATADASDAPTG